MFKWLVISTVLMAHVANTPLKSGKKRLRQQAASAGFFHFTPLGPALRGAG